MKTLVFLFLIAMLALPVLAQPGKCIAPANAELETFILQPQALSTAEQARLGLTPKYLEKAVTVHNHYRNLRGGCWPLESLPAGTLVLVDNKGVLRYKADCGNRIVEVLPCPSCIGTNEGIGGTGKISEVKGVNGASPSGSPGALSRFWDKAKKTWGDSWEAIGALLGFFLPFWLLFALLGLLGYLIYRAFQNRQQGQGGQGQNPPPPAQPLTPVPLAPAPQAVPAPAPGPVAVPPQPFPRNRFVVDLNEDGSERLQCGAQISRVQVDRGDGDGSTTIRISHRL